jgi:release factor glutamine methyltransferase
MTIQDAYKKSIDLLQRDFIVNPVLDARLLLTHVLNIDQKKFILIKDKKEITNYEWKKLRKILKKRLKGKSVATLINKKFFYDLEFYVNNFVLIPRPETEIIIDIVLEKFDKNSKVSILDIGTGSGNIAITLAKQFPFSNIDAMEKSRTSINVAKKNIEKHKISVKKLRLIKKDFFQYSSDKKYDIIVSNPPYIKTKIVKELIKKKLVSDPVRALNGGKQGLNFYYNLCNFAFNNLKDKGWMFIEHGYDQREKILNIFSDKHFIKEAYDDLAGLNRIIAIQKKG